VGVLTLSDWALEEDEILEILRWISVMLRAPICVCNKIDPQCWSVVGRAGTAMSMLVA
jgi:hypothetical protein